MANFDELEASDDTDNLTANEHTDRNQ